MWGRGSMRTGICLLLSLVGIAGAAHAQQRGCHLSFDGIDDRVVVPHSPAFPLSEFTLSAWMRSTAVTGQAILSRFPYSGFILNVRDKGTWFDKLTTNGSEGNYVRPEHCRRTRL